MFQIHYHNKENPLFEFDNFYYTFKSYTATFLQEKEGLEISTLLLNRDENGRVYGQYRFPKELHNKSNEDLSVAISYLEDYRIYMDKGENCDFSVSKMFHLFRHERLQLGKVPLKEISLGKYLTSLEEDILLDDLKAKPHVDQIDIQKFKKAEFFMVSGLIGKMTLHRSFFLPYPIFGHGNLVGVVFFIYDKSKLKRKYRQITEVYKYLTLGVTRSYENVQLWGQINRFNFKPLNHFFPYIRLFQAMNLKGYGNDTLAEEAAGLAPILRELGYEAYYQNQAKVLLKEIETTKNSEKDRIKGAIVSILVDSFAHNIGAHCLIALKWWFEKRSLHGLTSSLDGALASFFEFLRNKSAFWSGVRRDTLFSGGIYTWFDLIFKFSQNTLFLGTIANSEGVNKINIHVEILDADNKIIVGGEFAKVDLEIIKRETSATFRADQKAEKISSEHPFLILGQDFDAIKKELRKLDPIYLPGELVGQEALYTIWENCLRNVKHYYQVLDSIREGG